MKKMMLLAAMAAIAALMLAAAPAMAEDLDFDGFDDEFGFFCDNDDDDSNGFVECDDLFIVILVGDFEDFCDDFDLNGICDFDEEDDFCDFFDCDNDFDFEEFCDDFDGDFFCDDKEDFDFDGDGFQDFEQEAESGDVDQSFYVSNTGDNSNQSVAIQGVANTGNAQNQIGITQFDDFDGNNDFNNEDEFCDEFDEFCEDLEEFCEDIDGDGFCDEFFDFLDDFDRFDDGDGFGTGGDFEFEDVGASIEVSPTQTFESDQQVNQSAVAFGGKGWWY